MSSFSFSFITVNKTFPGKNGDFEVVINVDAAGKGEAQYYLKEDGAIIQTARQFKNRPGAFEQDNLINAVRANDMKTVESYLDYVGYNYQLFSGYRSLP